MPSEFDYSGMDLEKKKTNFISEKSYCYTFLWEKFCKHKNIILWTFDKTAYLEIRTFSSTFFINATLENGYFCPISVFLALIGQKALNTSN